MPNYICERCGQGFDEHEIFNREEPNGRQSGVFAGQEWNGLLCPQPSDNGK